MSVHLLERNVFKTYDWLYDVAELAKKVSDGNIHKVLVVAPKGIKAFLTDL